MLAQNIPLPGLSVIKTISIRLKPKEDLKASLDNFIAKHHIKAACIITCAGSLEKAVIRYANKSESETLIDKFEIVSLTGTIAESGSHIHISISDGTGKTIGGHLKEGSLIYTTAEIVLGIMPNVEYNRELDITYGYNELTIRKSNN